MKNQIIKKIMAYLLVGAMVISTPITASANELENAYASDVDAEGNPTNNTKSGTSTDTSTKTVSIDLPEEIEKHFPEIIGIALDRTSLEFTDGNTSAMLQARALFDDYDAAGEEMQWISADDKVKVEGQINWFSDDYNVATIGAVWSVDTKGNETRSETKQGNKAEIKPVGEGTTTIYAWIEADGKVYKNAPQRPTEGDYIAKATVTARDGALVKIKGIKFDKGNVPMVVKRQYDLKEYTTLEFTKTGVDGKEETITKKVSEYSGSVVYGLTNSPYGGVGSAKPKVKATLSDDGILKITKGNPNETIKFTITTESGRSEEFTIALDTPNPVKTISGGKQLSLDMGSDNINVTTQPVYNKEKGRVEQEVEITYTALNEGATTDEFVWSSNKKNIANVDVKSDGTKAVIYTTENVGSANITVKSTSGKKATFKVTVTATPDDIELSPVTTYTGKPVTMTATLIGKNKLTLPVGKTKLAYAFKDEGEGDTKVTAQDAKKLYAGINKKGVLTPKTLLSKNKGETFEDEVKVRVEVTGKLGNWTKSDSAVATIKQSSLVDLTITPTQYKNKDWSIVTVGDSILSPLSKSETKKTYKEGFYVGNTYRFTPSVDTAKSKGDVSSIVWTSTGKGIKSELADNEYESVLTSNAKATIKASYIEIIPKNGKNVAKKQTKTITIQPIQRAQSLVLDKPVQIVNVDATTKEVKRDTKVTIKVKALNPKTSKDTIQWKVLTASADTTQETVGTSSHKTIEGVKVESVKNGYVSVDNAVVDKDGKPGATGTEPSDTEKNKTLKITIPKGTKAGSVIKVGAYAQGGAVTYGYIYVTNQTSKVTASISDPATPTKKANGSTVKNNWDLSLNKTATITATLDIKGSDPVSSVEPVWTKGDTSAYVNEYLTYTVDKKGAQIIKIDKNGKITPMKAGKATITIKTASGKSSAKVTVNVTDPASGTGSK